MKYNLVAIILISFWACSFGEKVPQMRLEDKIRIKEAITISDKYGERLFEGYGKVPFAIILVTDSIEFLVFHPYPSDDFNLSEQDTILKTNIYYRKSRFSPNLLATFPAVNGLSCVVVGIPEKTNKNSTEWIVTLLHEHFHQYQNAFPDYYESVDKLDLSNSDQTGMWMLNYPFPYDNSTIVEQYNRYTKALNQAITNQNKKEFNSDLKFYLSERNKLKAILSEKDYRYFSFQVWQEGLARYTEYNFLELLDNYVPSNNVLSLHDFESFSTLKAKMYQNEMENLLNNKLEEIKRICFYSVGFAEGILLDKVNKSWRKKYLTDKFFVEEYIGEDSMR